MTSEEIKADILKLEAAFKSGQTVEVYLLPILECAYHLAIQTERGKPMGRTVYDCRSNQVVVEGHRCCFGPPEGPGDHVCCICSNPEPVVSGRGHQPWEYLPSGDNSCRNCGIDAKWFTAIDCPARPESVPSTERSEQPPSCNWRPGDKVIVQGQKATISTVQENGMVSVVWDGGGLSVLHPAALRLQDPVPSTERSEQPPPAEQPQPASEGSSGLGEFGSMAPPVNPSTLRHEFVPVTGGVFCGVCGGGKLHLVHRVYKPQPARESNG